MSCGNPPNDQTGITSYAEIAGCKTIVSAIGVAVAHTGLTLVRKPGANLPCVFWILPFTDPRAAHSHELFNCGTLQTMASLPTPQTFFIQDTGTNIYMTSPFSLIALVVGILIIGHSGCKKTSFSALNCSAFFCSSSLGKRMGCLLRFQPSCLFNDLQGKKNVPHLLFFLINLMT